MHRNRNQIIQWAESIQFEPENINQIIHIAEAEPKPTDWINFLKTSLLWSAMLSICCGVIFFFAYNWQDISRFTKFALVETVMLVSTLAYIRIASTKMLTSATLMAMSLLTGALLALVGQTYQTGADPWQLFATWALLILPWALIASASSLWILWMVLVNLSVLLYLEISHGIFGILLTDEIALWFFVLLNTALLCTFEYFSLRNKAWNNNRYVNQLLALAAGTATTILAIWSIFEYKMGVSEFAFYLVWIASAFYIYRYKLRDLFVLSMGSLSVIIIVISLLIKAIDNSMDEGGFLIVSFAIIGLSTLAGVWLKNLSQQFSKESDVIQSEASIASHAEVQ